MPHLDSLWHTRTMPARKPKQKARRKRQQKALGRAPELVDKDLLLSDAAWRSASGPSP